eukprot:CAMPEP_0174332572 /NCGR_PEP_ID=MMETSP0810-20121108/18420_1 /TAXON_ID=73025 ORGANISM="Eutreptiella gymnastica-like, Strain CCMP1594" /NCGR_SAMPLE_ID=MMETSP0810 /ASSEMBLY_ACC=CAM_ASM_000659 /LENGTH=71 /DNA_ID=CAMNT_0015449091 /DNA_START=488 /DNA_END=703 /DNA_ORIENTATION=-
MNGPVQICISQRQDHQKGRGAKRTSFMARHGWVSACRPKYAYDTLNRGERDTGSKQIPNEERLAEMSEGAA